MIRHSAVTINKTDGLHPCLQGSLACESHLQEVPVAELCRDVNRFRVFIHGEVHVRAAPHHHQMVPVLVVQEAAQGSEASGFRGWRPFWKREPGRLVIKQRGGEKVEKVNATKSPHLNIVLFHRHFCCFLCVFPSSLDPKVCSSLQL